jgi:hypothetical protein
VSVGLLFWTPKTLCIQPFIWMMNSGGTFFCVSRSVFLLAYLYIWVLFISTLIIILLLVSWVSEFCFGDVLCRSFSYCTWKKSVMFNFFVCYAYWILIGYSLCQETWYLFIVFKLDLCNLLILIIQKGIFFPSIYSCSWPSGNTLSHYTVILLTLV